MRKIDKSGFFFFRPKTVDPPRTTSSATPSQRSLNPLASIFVPSSTFSMVSAPGQIEGQSSYGPQQWLDQYHLNLKAYLHCFS